MSHDQSYSATLEAPFGWLGIRIEEGAITSIDTLPRRTRIDPADALARRVCRQLVAYFTDPTVAFDVPLRLAGTPYQQRVWRALQRIPSGRVLTYGQLAARLQSGPRAIGGACRANPVPIIVPCHRVVAADGLGGYMGSRTGPGLQMKEWLLSHERG